MKKWFLLAALAALAVLAYVAAGPYLTMHRIEKSIAEQDLDGLSAQIDFPAVRQSLRPQLDGNPLASAPAPSFMEDPVGAVRRQFEQATAPAAPDADAYLSPAALAALTRGEGRAASQRTGARAFSSDNGGPMPRPVYWGMNRARMSVADEGGATTLFTFERLGPFEWKLVHVGLPEGNAPAAGAARGDSKAG